MVPERSMCGSNERKASKVFPSQRKNPVDRQKIWGHTRPTRHKGRGRGRRETETRGVRSSKAAGGSGSPGRLGGCSVNRGCGLAGTARGQVHSSRRSLGCRAAEAEPLGRDVRLCCTLSFSLGDHMLSVSIHLGRTGFLLHVSSDICEVSNNGK